MNKGDWDFETGLHWISYVGLTLRYILGMAIWGGVAFALSAYFLGDPQLGFMEAGVHALLEYRLWLAAVAAVIFARYVYDILYLRSFRWKVGSEGVHYASGILPWRKIDNFRTYNQIFEAGYRYGFLGWLLNYGTIHIIGKEGNTSYTAQRMVAKAKRLQGEINRYLHASGG